MLTMQEIDVQTREIDYQILVKNPNFVLKQYFFAQQVVSLSL